MIEIIRDKLEKDGRWEAFTRFFRRRQAVSHEQRRLYIVRVVL